MENIAGCQLPNIPNLAEGLELVEPQPFLRRLKRNLAVPWNYYVKRWIKQAYHLYAKQTAQPKRSKTAQTSQPLEAIEPVQPERLKAGDWVRVRSWEEIQPLLDPFKETRGCAFLEDMRQYCGTNQRILKSMQRFLDERDYKVKKVNGVILLENVICHGTAAFGKCDRCCFLFWREEWLEKITS
jgi:hypothetical protein